MPSATRVFIYEYLSGGGIGDGGEGELAALASEGAAMRDALAADFARVPGVELARAVRPADAAGTRLPGIVDVAPEPHETAAQFLARHASGHDVVLVVAPETDGILATLRRSVGGERWLGCSAEAIDIAASKSVARRRLAAHGVATPCGWEPGDAEPATTSRWVVKPDDGAGCLDTGRFDTFAAARAELLARQVTGRPATMESWIDGEAMSLSLLCRPDGAELVSINRQAIAIDAAGAVEFEGVSVAVADPRAPRAAPFARLAAQVHAALPGLAGFVGVDVVVDAVRGPVAIEVNPRVTSAYVGLSAALDRNLARDLLAQHLAARAHVAA